MEGGRRLMQVVMDVLGGKAGGFLSCRDNHKKPETLDMKNTQAIPMEHAA